MDFRRLTWDFRVAEVKASDFRVGWEFSKKEDHISTMEFEKISATKESCFACTEIMSRDSILSNIRWLNVDRIPPEYMALWLIPFIIEVVKTTKSIRGIVRRPICA